MDQHRENLYNAPNPGLRMPLKPSVFALQLWGVSETTEKEKKNRRVQTLICSSAMAETKKRL